MRVAARAKARATARAVRARARARAATEKVAGAKARAAGGAGYAGYSYDYAGYESDGYYLVFAGNLGMLDNFKNSATLSPIPKNFEQLFHKKFWFSEASKEPDEIPGDSMDWTPSRERSSSQLQS